MKRNTIYLLLVAIVLIAVAIIVVPTMIAGNDADDQPKQQDQSPDAASESPELTENETTALEAAEIMTTWEPADDHNRTAAELRASHLMTDDRADEIVEPDRPAPGKYWNIAAQQQATSQPTVEINYATEAQDNMVSVMATWAWVADDDQVLPNENQQRVYYFHFNDDGEIADYTYQTMRQSGTQGNAS